MKHKRDQISYIRVEKKKNLFLLLQQSHLFRTIGNKILEMQNLEEKGSV